MQDTRIENRTSLSSSLSYYLLCQRPSPLSLGRPNPRRTLLAGMGLPGLVAVLLSSTGRDRGQEDSHKPGFSGCDFDL